MIALWAVGAWAQDTERLPPHAWVLAEGSVDAVRGQLGATFAVRPELALAVGATATEDRAGLVAGVTFEAGALALMSLVGAEVRYDDRRLGGVAELSAVVEAPPLPVYLESWTRFGVRAPFQAGRNDWETRAMLLWTFGRPIAAGLELDAASGSLPLGLRANVGLGRHVDLGAFAGFELRGDARDETPGGSGLVARLALVVAG